MLDASLDMSGLWDRRPGRSTTVDRARLAALHVFPIRSFIYARLPLMACTMGDKTSHSSCRRRNQRHVALFHDTDAARLLSPRPAATLRPSRRLQLIFWHIVGSDAEAIGDLSMERTGHSRRARPHIGRNLLIRFMWWRCSKMPNAGATNRSASCTGCSEAD